MQPGIIAIQEKAPAIKAPDTFDGIRSKLESFLSSVDLYIAFNANLFANYTLRVIFAVSFLRRSAFHWISVYLNDYQANWITIGTCHNNAKPATKAIFKDISNFKAVIQAIYGDVSEQATAEREIRRLKQKGSVGNYTAKFQQYADKTGWDQTALKNTYYIGLKDLIKNKLTQIKKPETL